jgi:hypothetical protein
LGAQWAHNPEARHQDPFILWAQAAKIPALAGIFEKAAEEIRTLDLLHGKQTL